MVESNVRFPKKQVVKFYNSDQQLIYQETYDQKILNFSRKNIRKILDNALVAVLNRKNSDETANLAKVIQNKYWSKSNFNY